MDLQGPDFSDSRDPMIIFADSRDPIFNSRDPNRSLKRLKKTAYSGAELVKGCIIEALSCLDSDKFTSTKNCRSPERP